MIVSIILRGLMHIADVVAFANKLESDRMMTKHLDRAGTALPDRV